MYGLCTSDSYEWNVSSLVKSVLIKQWKKFEVKWSLSFKFTMKQMP